MVERRKFRQGLQRAPLKTEVLYREEGSVLKGSMINISENGLLLGHLPRVPEENPLPLMFSLIQYPDFSKLKRESVSFLEPSQMKTEVIRVRGSFVRFFEEKENLEEERFGVGYSFVNLERKERNMIKEYTSRYIQNLTYFLSLFEIEKEGGGKLDQKFLKKIALLLGHDPQMEVEMLRVKALHDLM